MELKASDRTRSQVIPLLRKPEITDGPALQSLVRDSEYLDQNSLYCYLLVCSRFRNSSIVAVANNTVLGFISAFASADRPHVLFVWQVGVHARARRQGLAKRMLLEILRRDNSQHFACIETTVTRDNLASRRLFQSIQQHFGCTLEETPYFSSEIHFDNQHETEYLLRIGPINPDNQNEQSA